MPEPHKAKQARQTVAYTDGSAYPNPGGDGGWAVVFEDGRELFDSAKETTNNRMEIAAVIAAVNAGATVIHTDSMYVVGTITLGWKRRKNNDLWDQLDEALQGHRVEIVHVKGHNGTVLNERADELAAEARLSVGKEGPFEHLR